MLFRSSKIKIHELKRQDQEIRERAAANVFAQEEATKRTQYSEGQSNKRNEATIAAGLASERNYIDDWLRKNPGKSYSDAYTAFRIAHAGSAAERQDLAELKALQKVYADQADITKNFNKASREEAQRRLEEVNKKIASMAGVSQEDTSKIITNEDIKATAKASGKTEAQVREQAIKQGYTIK